jgi:hypothetical protein
MLIPGFSAILLLPQTCRIAAKKTTSRLRRGKARTVIFRPYRHIAYTWACVRVHNARTRYHGGNSIHGQWERRARAPSDAARRGQGRRKQRSAFGRWPLRWRCTGQGSAHFPMTVRMRPAKPAEFYPCPNLTFLNFSFLLGTLVYAQHGSIARTSWLKARNVKKDENARRSICCYFRLKSEIKCYDRLKVHRAGIKPRGRPRRSAVGEGG